MKILLVAPQPFYEERGTPIAVRLLAETLCQFGHEVDLLVYHAGEDIAVPGLRLIRAARPPGVRNVPIGISLQKIACDLSLIIAMARLLRRNKYDVIHAVEEAVFPAALFSVLARTKLIYDMDSSMSEQLTDKWVLLKPLKGLLERIERAAVRRSATVLAVCEDLAAKVRPWVGAQDVVVLPDVPMSEQETDGPVDSLREIAGDAAVIGLYVGNLERYQGIDLLVEAIGHLSPQESIRMIVIGGDPADVERYRARASQVGASERLHFLGARPVAHLNAYLKQADILVSPRLLGGNTPMKIYSYMQSGKVTLATDIRSHTQVLDSECAEIVPVDAAEIAGGLVRLAADTERRQRLGRAAQRKVEQEYSLPVFQRKLRVVYEKVGA